MFNIFFLGAERGKAKEKEQVSAPSTSMAEKAEPAKVSAEKKKGEKPKKKRKK